jgi:hypothetical protein
MTKILCVAHQSALKRVLAAHCTANRVALYALRLKLQHRVLEVR